MFGNIKDTYASSVGGTGSSFDTFNCACKGEYMTTYKLGESPYYFYSFTHNLDSEGVVISDQNYIFERSAEDDEFYSVKITAQGLGTGIDLYIAYIYISSDASIARYDKDGNIYYTNVTSFSNRGTSNDKYYTFAHMLNGTYPYVHLYDSGFDYSMNDINLGDLKNLLNELAKFLCGELTELPPSITVDEKKPVYDLEAPLGVTVTSSEHSRNFQIYGDGLYQGSDLVIPYKIWWNQSNIDLTGYETEFYVREYGKYKKSLFSSWVDVVTPYVFDKSFVTAKYCNNSLKYYEFSPKDKKRIYSYCQNEIGEEPYAVEFYHPDFMLRNKMEDEDGRMHYSNWVYVKTYDDGTYSVFEMEQEYEIENDPDETGNIDIDSPNYDDEIIYEENDTSIDVGGIGNAGTFLTVLKDLANSIKTFPDFFGEVFSFLPSWILTSIGILFIIVLVCAIF